uniref:Integrin subunit alpha E n=1 Tax=Apteryx owenii TaxID=8824 RepID=A0A8B9PM67_APTOW
FTTTEDMNGVCTLLTPDLHSTAFLNLTKIGIGAKPVLTLNSWEPSPHSFTFHILAGSGTEIVFILDGSGSIEPEDFEKAKAFIHKMMKTLYQKCFECDFAVVQYGFEIRTEFDLRENWNPNATLQKVLDIVQVCNVTKTASAMQHALDSIFVESHGSQKNAAKVMIVLTDGEILLDEMNLTTVINSPKMAGIERYAIGVGDAFKKPKALNELRLIASGPDDTNVFQVTDYSALDGLLSTLQQSIIGIEGTQGDALEYELAQAGFSVQILDKQVLMFGAVGAFDWSGGILLYELATKTAVFLNESKEEAKKAKYSYLGYSMAVVSTGYGALYVAGAPRHSMTGKVLVFQDGRLKQTLPGEQVGSYFGSELCPLDVNRDGVTDLLLVGAPFYHIRGEEGRVYVYRLETETGSFTLEGHLNVQVTSPFARFGFTVASIGDINRDGYEDIAVGAPLEDQLSNSSSFGSIYIFNGDKDGIKSSFSQRIKASEISSELQYFGQSIDGGFDFTEDGLQDITVGSLKNVVFSRPVVQFLTSMRFTPERILILQNNSLITAKLCFSIISALPKLYVTYLIFLSASRKELVVGYTEEVTMNFSLSNSGDDSYMTTMVLDYSENLNFKKMTPSSPVIHCGQPVPSTSIASSLNCRIGHPILSKTTVSRDHYFHFLLLPVSLMYVNVSQGLVENKEFKFNINGENRFKATIQLQIWVPIRLQGHNIISVKNATGTQVHFLISFDPLPVIIGSSVGGLLLLAFIILLLWKVSIVNTQQNRDLVIKGTYGFKISLIMKEISLNTLKDISL